MNIALKKVAWDADNQPDTPQTLSLSFRKQNAPDVGDSYTLVTDSLYVLTNGTVVNPPLIKGLENATAYVFRLAGRYGGRMDVVYVTPEEVQLATISGQYTPNSRIECTSTDVGFYIARAPSGFAFYSLENHFSDMLGTKSNILLNGAVIPKKEASFIGMYIDSQTGSMVAPDLNMNNMFGANAASAYSLGVYFYAASTDLPATGHWPLLSCVDPDGYGVIVYVDNATKEIVWQQKSATLTESVRSTSPILMDAWNNILLGSYFTQSGNPLQTYMFLNGTRQGDATITAASLPSTLSTDALLNVGHLEYGEATAGKGIFRNVYVNNSMYYSNVDFNGLPYPIGYLQSRFDPDRIITIPQDNLVQVSKNKLGFTIPQDVTPGPYTFHAWYIGRTTTPIDIIINPINRYSSELDIDLVSNEEGTHLSWFDQSFYVLGQNQKGEADGGVVPENVYFKDGMLVLEAHGDWYDGIVQGLNADGTFKKHTAANDPLLGENWKTRVGAAVATKGYCGYGSYKVEAKLPAQMGVAPFFRLYHHAMVECQDPFYEECLNNGLHQQGATDDENGFYAIVRNEFSMELPANDSVTAFDTLDEVFSATYTAAYAGMKVAVLYGEPESIGTWQLNVSAAPQQPSSWTKYSDEVQRLYHPRRDQVKLTNAKGTLGSGVGVSNYPADNQDEFLEMHVPIGKDIWDGEFHEFRMDWYANRVAYYIDGVLLGTNNYFVPDIEGRFSFGVAFPSAPLSGSDWLTDPAQLSAGLAAWHHQAMIVRKVSYLPFTEEEAGGNTRTVGETNPYAGIYEFPQLIP